MKYLYKTPEINVEELMKQDVLCVSNETVETTPAEDENYSLGKSIWNDLTSV